MFTYVALQVNEGKDSPVTTALLFTSAFAAVVTICAVFIATSTFKFLKIIKRNRLSLSQQIKSIGTDNE